MKILQINTFCGIESTGRIAVDIHTVLEKQGHTSYIAYGRDKARNCSNGIKIGKDLDNYFHVALSRAMDKHGFGSRIATEKFLETLDELDPDVIHLHNIHGYYLNIEMLFNYLKKVDKPVIWTLHDCWSFTGHCAYFDYIGCEKWETGCHSCPQLQSYPKSLLIDNSKENYIRKKEVFRGVKNLTVVTPSKWLAGLVKKSYLSEYPLRVINNGIDLNVFKPVHGNFRKEYGLEDKVMILGVANVWTARKGLQDFIKLSPLLPENSVIVIVGLDDSEAKELPSNMIPIARTKNAGELAEIYATADVFLNPTYEDNFPTTNLEAIACGTPVITYNTGGSIESVTPDCGEIVEQGNIQELSIAINKIMMNSDPGYTEACIQKSRNLYNKDDRFVEYTDLYEEVQHQTISI